MLCLPGDAKTPRTEKIWKILLSHPAIFKFNDKFNLKQRFDDLSFLHNYVHTKGAKFSNDLGGLKGNSQVFVPKAFDNWLSCYEKIVQLITTFHLLKYPLSVIEFDYRSKFGIDMPNFGGLEKAKLDKVASILPAHYLEEIKDIAASDEQTQAILKGIQSLPDKTEAEVEEQVLNIYKMSIEHGEGFIEWEKQQHQFLEQMLAVISETAHADLQKITQQRIQLLKPWAIENNFMESKGKRFGWES